MTGVERQRLRRIALVGNPNTGKTTLFNRLTGLRHRTANFPGTTLEARAGALRGEGAQAELIDLPGIYSLELDQPEAGTVREVLAGRTAPRGEPVDEPGALLIVVDASNLPRNLVLVGEALRRRLPTVVALTMVDVARRAGVHVDPGRLAEALGCEVLACNPRRGEGVDGVRGAITRARVSTRTAPGTSQGLRAWADETAQSACAAPAAGAGARDHTERLDLIVTDPAAGLAIFAGVMGGLFWLLFKIAAYPMDLIDAVFARLSTWTHAAMPDGILADFLADGVVLGIGATVIFLPQIVLLFFVISLLEDTGYLARAAFVVDRWLRPFGLPGHAFMPLLSSHACALPGIMATRAIPDRRERLATILVAPFMTCSARLPVYVLVTSLLFPGSPGRAALAFIGCYALGIAAGLVSALVARRTILRGVSRPMMLELPTYKLPSVRTAARAAFDRGLIFLRQAGTNILAICVVLWWLSSFPRVEPPADAGLMRAQAMAIRAGGAAPGLDPDAGSSEREAFAGSLEAQAEHRERSNAGAMSYAGRLGRAIQPVFSPMDFDWRLTVGIVASFAAREVFVSTMSVVVAGEEDAQSPGVLDRIAAATRDDGVTPIFTPAVSWALLAYYVLAMQCLPTLAVTAREAGGWKWAALQQAWATGLAFVVALIVHGVVA